MGRIAETIRCMVRLTDSAILEVAIRCSSAFSPLTDALNAETQRQTIEQPKRASGRSFASVVTRKRPSLNRARVQASSFSIPVAASAFQAFDTELSAASMADPDDSPVNGPFFGDDSLLFLSQPNVKPSHGGPACVPTQEMLSIHANWVIGLAQSLGDRNASFATARGIISRSAASVPPVWSPWTRCMPPSSGGTTASRTAGKTRLSLLIIPS